MSTRPFFKPQIVVPATAANMATPGPIVSSATICQNYSLVSYDISWTSSSGAPRGTFTIEASNTFDLNGNGQPGTGTNGAPAGTWTAIGFWDGASEVASKAISAGDSGSAFLQVVGFAGYAIRLRYTFTSGTGTLTATVAGKAS